MWYSYTLFEHAPTLDLGLFVEDYIIQLMTLTIISDSSVFACHTVVEVKGTHLIEPVVLWISHYKDTKPCPRIYDRLQEIPRNAVVTKQRLVLVNW